MTKSKYKLLPNYTLEKITPKVNANTLVPPPTPQGSPCNTHMSCISYVTASNILATKLAPLTHDRVSYIPRLPPVLNLISTRQVHCGIAVQKI